MIQSLLQIQDMPALWHVVENSQWRFTYKCDGVSYTRGFAPIFKPGRDTSSQVYVSHTIYECSNATTAEARFYESSQPNPNIVGPISHIGDGRHPAHANKYNNYCGNFRDGSVVCMTVALYGNVVSVVEVYKTANTPLFPIYFDITESNLLDWVMVRNDRLLAGAP